MSTINSVAPFASIAQAMQAHEGEKVTKMAYGFTGNETNKLYKVMDGSGKKLYHLVTPITLTFDGDEQKTATVVYNYRIRNDGPISKTPQLAKSAKTVMGTMKAIEKAAMDSNDVELVKKIETYAHVASRGFPCKKCHSDFSVGEKPRTKLKKFVSLCNDKLDGDEMTLAERAKTFEKKWKTDAELEKKVAKLDQAFTPVIELEAAVPPKVELPKVTVIAPLVQSEPEVQSTAGKISRLAKVGFLLVLTTMLTTAAIASSFHNDAV